MEKLIQVSMTYQREDGSMYRRTIADDEVIKWKKMTDSVCMIAQVHGANLDWRSVNWVMEELTLPINQSK